MKVLSTCLLLLGFYAIECAKITKRAETATGSFIQAALSASSLAVQNITNPLVIPSAKREVTSTKAPPPAISTTMRKHQPPKKYISTTKSNEPTKIALSKTSVTAPTPTSTLACPKENEAKFNLFAASCTSDGDCWNKDDKCCNIFGSRNCIRGVPKPAEEPRHDPFFGLIPRRCPERPLAELWWDLKTCESDGDCWPRVCCPDGRNKYCRTSTLEYSSFPFALGRPMAYLSQYLECSPRPPTVFDLHPKQCNSTFDCFPNVCCQEAGKKHCRPPKKSILPLMANFLNTGGLLRRFTT